MQNYILILLVLMGVVFWDFGKGIKRFKKKNERIDIKLNQCYITRVDNINLDINSNFCLDIEAMYVKGRKHYIEGELKNKGKRLIQKLKFYLNYEDEGGFQILNSKILEFKNIPGGGLVSFKLSSDDFNLKDIFRVKGIYFRILEISFLP